MDQDCFSITSSISSTNGSWTCHSGYEDLVRHLRRFASQERALMSGSEGYWLRVDNVVKRMASWRGLIKA